MLVRNVKAAARTALEFLNTYTTESRAALAVMRLERGVTPVSVVPTHRHLDAAIAWIARAQDACTTGGVPWGYRARRAVRTSQPMGWVGPYPETTGYIIPTMLRYADIAGDKDAIERSCRMMEW